MNNQSRDEFLKAQREASSYQYLTKRETERVELFEKLVRDEETMFEGVKLSREEQLRQSSNKRVMAAVENRRGLTEELHSAYRMPTDNYFAKEDHGSTNEYPTKQLTYESDNSNWEKAQISKNLPQTVSNDSVPEKDLIFDQESLGFILRDTLKPSNENEHILKIIQGEREKCESILQTKQSLPIYPFREDILSAIDQFQVLILVGETGSGKTTQLPQYLIENGYTQNGSKKICCTQPRRVAAMSVAARVAEEMRVKLGYEVGYSIRFEDCTSDRTILKYMTDGMLLRDFINEPDLSSYSVIIIDEAHERTLHTDILLGLVKDIAKFRKDLKVIISSATMDADKFSDYFDGAPIFTVPGRRYDVDIYYTTKPQPDYIDAVIRTCIQIHCATTAGDILVFLPGQEEIEVVHDNLQLISKKLGKTWKELIITPIYSNLPSEMQAKIFAPTPMNCRKIVLATNIAETSITIEGIVFVVDPGFVKQKNYNPRTGIESLIETPCSRAAAQQRAGRAGRVGPGKCFRLYTEWAFEHELEPNTIPEIQRTHLGNVVLLLKSLGIDDLVNFDFLDTPSPEALIKALEELYALGALSETGELTKTGRRMAEFPLDPSMSKTIIAAEKFGCTEEVLSIISMLSTQGALFYVPKDKKTQAEVAKDNLSLPEGDHLTLLNIWNEWVNSSFSKQWCFENFLQHRSMKRARDVRDQLKRLLERVEIELRSSSDGSMILKALLSGYFFHTACLQRSGETYRTIKSNRTVFLHPSSVLSKEKPKWVLFHELVMTSKEFIRQVSEIRPEWLIEVAPHYISQEEIDKLTDIKSKPTSRSIKGQR